AYYVTATDVNGCTGSDSVLVNVLPLPFAIPGADEDICTGDTTTITASGGDIYSWSDGIITSVTGARPASPLTTTIYSVTVEDSNGCKDTTVVTVTVHPIPAVSLLGLNAAYCNNDEPDTLAGSPAGGFFAGPAISGSVFSPALLLPGNYTILYTYIDSFGCMNSDSSDVVINDAPTISFTGLAAEYCMDTSAHLLTGIPSGGAFFGPGVSGNTFVSFYAGPGIHDIVYIHDGGGFCPGKDTQSVAVHALPVVSISGLDSLYCTEGNPDTLTGIPAGGTFSGDDVFGNIFFPPGVVFQTPSVVSYEYFDSNGCAGKAVEVAVVYPTPSPVILNPGALCVNDGAVQLSGYPSGGTFSGPGISNNVMMTSIAGAGIHLVQYSFTDNSGCTGDTSLFITINGAPSVTLSGLDTAYCVNDALVLMNGNPAGGDYSGTGVTGHTFNPSLAGTGGPYLISYTYTDTNGCSATATQLVTVLNAPFLIISGLNSFYCIFDAPVAVNTLPAGGTLSGAGISNDVFDPAGAGIGTHIITYRYTNAEGCTELAKTFVRVDACVGVNSPDLERGMTVYPNPSEGTFTLEVQGMMDEVSVVKIFDVAGKLVYQEKISGRLKNYKQKINISAFSKGVYYLKLNFEDGMAVRKIIVQ
ncbi:MAG TPA: T9SS type A sorting domain-containing protein, partial [Chitinophagales bacterium]|nr:T9SS type A sorting domain-containing protein [Chitinophagales bacterium]